MPFFTVIRHCRRARRKLAANRHRRAITPA